MGSSNRKACSRHPPGGLNLALSIGQTRTPQRLGVRVLRRMQRAGFLAGGCLLSLGPILVLSGFSSPPPSGNRLPLVQGRKAALAWQELLESLVRRARLFQVKAELSDEKDVARLIIETPMAFEDEQDRLKPIYADFLTSLSVLLQTRSDLRLVVTGFGNSPARHYNPVLLGRRVRAVQVFFAENGIPVDRIEARVKEALAYEGPTTLRPKALSGQLITVHFVSA